MHRHDWTPVRSSRLLLALTVAALACSTLALAPATTAARPDTGVPYLAQDIGGDANAVNGQGVEDVGEVATGPAQLPSADLLGARITSRWTTVVTPDGDLQHELSGLEFRTALAALPTESGPGLLHRFRGEVAGCRFWVQFSAGTAGGGTHGDASVRRFGQPCGVADDAAGLPGDATTALGGFAVDVSTGEVVVGFAIDDLPKPLPDLLAPGAAYLLEGLEVRHHSAVGITAPVIDLLDGAGATAELGADVPPYDGPTREELCAGVGAEAGTTPTQGDDRTGTGGATLTLGVHAPMTGAAPLPSSSFTDAADLYWRALTETCDATVAGRTNVDVLVRDDRDDPNSAGAACSELASVAFVVAGVSGADQHHRCGSLAAHGAYPYLAVGTTEAGLRGNPWHFATSMSWRRQGALLAQFVAANPHDLPALGPGATIGVVRVASPHADDAEEGWRNGLAAEGLAVTETYRHTRGDRSWIRAAGQQFKDAGVDVVYVLTDPITYLDMVRDWSETLGYRPQPVGVDAGLAYDAMLATGCRGGAEDGAVFLSQTPALDAAPDAFLDAAARFEVAADDVALRLWGLAEAQHVMLDAYTETFGGDLTREDFRALLADGGGFPDATYPGVTYAPDDHSGGTGMHVVQADCDTQRHVTLAQHARGF